MATVRVDVIRDRGGEFLTQTRVNPSINDRVRLGDYLCSFEAEIEGGLRQTPKLIFQMDQKIAIFLGVLMVRGLDDATRAVPDLKIIYT